MRRTVGLSLVSALLLMAIASRADAFTYVSSASEIDRIVHQTGYDGSAASLTITVGIDPTSVNADAMVISTRNVIYTWNQLVATTGNLQPGALTAPGNQADFESILLHEMGHALGLGHPNVGSGVGTSNYTASTPAANSDAGVDGIIGSADDVRGSDVNLNWFRTSNNNPFTIAGTVDLTTYSRDIANLPGTDLYSANPDRDVAADLGFADTEAAMQQGAFWDEIQRTLGHDDVAGILYSMTGQDETVGGGEDYTFELVYAGKTTSADIVLDFDGTQTDLGRTFWNYDWINGDHRSIGSADIYFEPDLVGVYGAGHEWEFNTVLIPEPSAFAMLAGGGLGLLVLAWRRRRTGKTKARR